MKTASSNGLTQPEPFAVAGYSPLLSLDPGSSENSLANSPKSSPAKAFPKTSSAFENYLDLFLSIETKKINKDVHLKHKH